MISSKPTSGQFPEPASDAGAVQQPVSRTPNRMRRSLPVCPSFTDNR
jgi:hypothetical protein